MKRLSFFLFLFKNIDGSFFSPHIHYYICSYFLYYIFVCLSKVFQRTISFCFRSLSKAFAKVRAFFVTAKLFRKFFFKKFFWRRKSASTGCRSRSLNAVKVRYLDCRRTAASCSLSFQIVISSTSFPLESGCKITHFFASSNFYKHFFSNFLKNIL